MALAPGNRIGGYEIVALLGAGGMGEVYRARDTKLNRDVALKMLPEAFTFDGDRIARFRREAQVLASLNHPNIAAIYGFEDSGRTHALVLELVEGPTLADRIAQGAIPLDDALPIARQIAEALEAAHEQGIIHRDLKPTNIKVRTDGTVKVLDFGLAKMLEPGTGAPASPSVTQSPTITSPAMMTGVGMILGTAAYMSPEQARGSVADKRSDIWAFGCVVFEMLSGRRAFDGEDVSETLANVLKGAPDWNAVPRNTPRPIRTLLTRCLQKDPKRRLPAIGVAQLDIDDALSPPSEIEPTAGHPGAAGRRERVAWSFTAISLIVAIATGLTAYLFRPRDDAQVIRFTISPPDGWALNRAPIQFAISPDGRRLVFDATDRAGRASLWIRGIDSLSAQELPGTEGATAPFWSPDSRYVGFRAGAKLKKIAIAGGQPVTLCESPEIRGAAWSGAGVIVFASGQGFKKVSESGGAALSVDTVPVNSGTPSLPTFLPDGRHFLYRTFAGLFIASLDSADRKQIFSDTGPQNVAYADGHLLFEQGGALMAQPFNVRQLELTGEPRQIVDSVQTFSGPRIALFSISSTGVLAYRAGTAAPQSRLVWFDRQGKELATVGDTADYADVSLSPDAAHAAVTILDPTQHTRNIWIVDTVRGLRTQFTFDPAEEVAPAWSRDGTRIAFSSRRNGRWGIYQKPASGAGAEQATIEFAPDALVANPLDWTADNHALLFVQGNTGAATLSMLPLVGERKPVILLTRGAAGPGQLSPDDRWIAYFSGESGRPEVYVMPYPDRGGRWRVSISGGTQPRWRRDGKELFYHTADGKIMAADVAADHDVFHVGEVRPLFTSRLVPTRFGYDVTADGQRFLMNTQVFDQTSTSPITVVVNWPAGVAR